MRKAISLAVCATALASAGPLAALEASTLAPLSDPLSARVAQAVQMLRGTPEPTAKAPLAAAEPGRATRTQAQPAESRDEGAGSYVVMLAGLIIMGAIVRRR